MLIEMIHGQRLMVRCNLDVGKPSLLKRTGHGVLPKVKKMLYPVLDPSALQGLRRAAIQGRRHD